MNFETIIFEIRDTFAIITLNRPDKLNALNKQMFNDLNSAIEYIELNDDICGLILTGSGEKAFAAGADIAELHLSDSKSGRIFSEYGSKIMMRLEQLRKPVIGAINGFALGGGCELAMSCHIRYASENAKFGLPEVSLGIIPGYGGTQRMTQLIGRAKTMELILSTSFINAIEAKRLNLINEVYPISELLNKSIELLNKILSQGNLAVFAAIDSILSSSDLSLSDGLAYESRKFGEVCGTKDFKEGTSAFLEKRKPEFKGN
ncbi:MAG: enoyl-CoA hydratase-related protein [Candidatus Kapabacteria bacterium]|nr:enoyl-CoA hydratase-related protein [Candidatus Kapabacteria bacterium]